MTERRYIFTTTRFRCGCAYRIIGDTAVFCPQHREIITGTERIETPEPTTPDVPGLVMEQYLKGVAHTLMNTRRNSLHTLTSVLDGRGNEWAEPSEELVGMCAACFIDQEEHYETGMAMCECGDKDCSYRWCGSGRGPPRILETPRSGQVRGGCRNPGNGHLQLRPVLHAEQQGHRRPGPGEKGTRGPGPGTHGGDEERQGRSRGLRTGRGAAVPLPHPLAGPGTRSHDGRRRRHGTGDGETATGREDHPASHHRGAASRPAPNAVRQGGSLAPSGTRS